jgi:hypothetical protein
MDWRMASSGLLPMPAMPPGMPPPGVVPPPVQMPEQMAQAGALPVNPMA